MGKATLEKSIMEIINDPESKFYEVRYELFT